MKSQQFLPVFQLKQSDDICMYLKYVVLDREKVVNKTEFIYVIKNDGR